VNIFAPTPRIKPSAFESIAGEHTAFANPVMGTRVPAPAFLAILSKIPMEVNKQEIKINETETKLLAIFSSSIYFKMKF